MKKLVPAALLLFVIFPLYARDVWILVEDAELGLPLEGAVIRSWDQSAYTCGEDGRALISAPDDKQVVIHAAYPGYENGRLVITTEKDSYTIGLRLSGVMEGNELVIEAEKPGTGETRTGRSVALSEREIAQTAEIGIIEDVMSSIKLLPGVGYTGLFDAQPSIRGGFPGDMNASLDGYYIMNPYHWGGGFSIFDPRMVQSAQLSHGVFSTRYGHTISGLLDITSKTPSPADIEFELAVNTSAANFNLSFPLGSKGSLVNKGGILVMGRVTYYDPVVWLTQQLGQFYQDIGLFTREQVEMLNAVRAAPYIRSGTIIGNYRFTDTLELHATGFWGMDGVGFTYESGPHESGGQQRSSRTKLDWSNYQGFITAALDWNPRNDMLAKFSIGTGYEDALADADIRNTVAYNNGNSVYDVHESLNQSDLMFNVQTRADYDWDLGKGFLFAAGIQEMFTRYGTKGDQQGFYERKYKNLNLTNEQKAIIDLIIAGLSDPSLPSSDVILSNLSIAFPVTYSPNAANFLFTTSGYSLIEYASPNKRFNAEFGVRVDHYYLLGEGLSLGTMPVVNPRLNVDYNVFKDKWIIESLDISAGTGLFSSIDKTVFAAEKQYGLKEVKANRSFTSVLGTRVTFPEGLIFNIEGYFKYIFDRMYVPINIGIGDFDLKPQFNGEGLVWGIDIMLQKLQSRYWDGWISYSFNWAKYRDPSNDNAGMGISGGARGNDWYFPDFHRFSNLNLIVNIKPVPQFNIYTRFGLASGNQISRRTTSSPTPYYMLVYDDVKLIRRYEWPSVRDENNRATPTLSMDIKFSLFGKNRTGKTRYEVYLAVENLLSLVYRPQGNTRFNSYTGEVETGSDSASYGLPIPIPSFGFKVSY